MESDPSRETVTMLHHFFADSFLQTLLKMERTGFSLPASPEFIASFYAGGISIEIGIWIQNHFKTSVEEFAANLYQLMSIIFSPSASEFLSREAAAEQSEVLKNIKRTEK